MPRDYIRRRRAIRRISNVVIVVLLSAAVAYAIVHISGPSAFPGPHR
jgi:predicted PurR-regulated permease PerM